MFDNLLASVITPCYVSGSQIEEFHEVIVGKKSIRLRIIAYQWSQSRKCQFKQVFPSGNTMLSSSQLNENALYKLKAYIDSNKDKVKFSEDCGDYVLIIDDAVVAYNRAKSTLTDSQKVVVRLRELSELKEGWLNGEGNPYKISDLNKVYYLIHSHFQKADIPLPYIYPSLSNKIRLEWDFPMMDVSYELDLTTESGELNILNNDLFEVEVEEVIPLSEASRIVEEIQKITRRGQ